MSLKFSQLQEKEVICVGYGRRLGYVCDADIEIPEGTIKALIVPGKCKLPYFWMPKEDYVIPWHCICKIGPDIILVDLKPDDCCIPRRKKNWR